MQLPAIPELQDEFTSRWHSEECAGVANGLEGLVIEQHRQNFALWHKEDRARAPIASAEEVAQVKRTIDHLNQARNDLVEAIDRDILQQLEREGVRFAGELHSETPGMMIDRLSILSLKIFHTREQLERTGVSPGHIERNRERLNLLLQQRADLANCLNVLWADLHNGRRTIKLYRQLKMYNDPELNPEIYRARAKTD